MYIIHLKLVFKRLREYNLKIKLLKYKFFKKELKFLKYRIFIEKIYTNMFNIIKIQRATLLKNKKEIRGFLELY